MKSIFVSAAVVLAASLSALADPTPYLASPDGLYEPAYARPPGYEPLGAFGTPRWTGFTVGAQWGGGAGGSRWSDPTGLLEFNTPRLPATGGQAGLLGGGNVGYGYQIRNVFIGAEAEASGAGLTGNAPCGGTLGVGGFGWNCRSHTDILSSASLRGGIVEGDTLVYGKVGVAYAQESAYTETWVPGYPSSQSGATLGRFGLTVGGGVEVSLNSHWSARAEYDYYGFGSQSFYGIDPVYLSRSGASFSLSENVVKFGLNFRFGGAVLPAEPLSLTALDDLVTEIGARTGYSTGGFRKSLYDPYTPGQLNSRLKWSDQNGAPIESYIRVDHKSGVYGKVMFGGIELANATMTDEDFPPAISPYSKTTSTTQNGRTLYGVADLGYDPLRGANWKAGGFVGYSYYQQEMNANGCSQTQAGSSVCQPPGFVPASQLTLSQSEIWNAVRLGVSGDVTVAERINLAGEAAWLPYAHLSATDNHWLRPDIDPMSETGVSHNSFQLEGVASYRFNNRASLGLGVRYWAFVAADGGTTFPTATARSAESFNSDRTTVFVQLAMKLGILDGAQPVVAAKY
ncbi:outer membrane beta-barrel protein [Rhodoblastus sp.]|uniref:outer membrane beta-barrel protein n=1 Tax=Rhodoblastus sp. TaxID=1962975 RepID=UPI003F9D1107